jgi:hypothetical protein
MDVKEVVLGSMDCMSWLRISTGGGIVKAVMNLRVP